MLASRASRSPAASTRLHPFDARAPAAMLRRCPSAGRAAPLPAGAPAATPAAGLPSSSQRRPPRHLPSPPSKAASPAASCATGSCSLPARRSVRRPGTPLQAPLQAVPAEPGLECLVPPLPVRPHAIGAPSRRLFPSTTDAGVLEPPWRPVLRLGSELSNLLLVLGKGQIEVVKCSLLGVVLGAVTSPTVLLFWSCWCVPCACLSSTSVVDRKSVV